MTVKKLPHDVTFLHREDPLDPPEHRLPLRPDLTADDLKFRVDSQSTSIMQTYLRLREAGYQNVSIAPWWRPGGICVVANGRFAARDHGTNCFVVSYRMDKPRPVMADMTIVQNLANVEGRSEVYMPYWPQPGLIPRADDRGDRIETLAYKGRLVNFYEPFRTPEFQAELGRLGVRLVLDLDEGEKQAARWHDYSEADLVIAVRDLTKQDALIKPASKLVNAWIAGSPAILGPEPAYRDERRSDLDYVEVRSPADVLEAVRRLKEHPELYRRMIDNGRQRAADFTTERMVERWVAALSGPIAEGYRRWLETNRLGRLLRFPGRVLRQREAQRIYLHNIHHGYRILSGTTT